jgi:hypothetical protein
MAAGAYGSVESSPHSGKEAKRESSKVGSWYYLQRHFSSNHLLQLSLPPKISTTSPNSGTIWGPRIHMSLWNTLHIQTITLSNTKGKGKPQCPIMM